MDKELKQMFFDQFEKGLKRMAEKQHHGKGTPLDMGQWLFTTMPNFIEDVFQAGKEVGDLDGRLAGHALGVKEERERIKKLELKNATLN